MAGILLEGSKLSGAITTGIVSSSDPQFMLIITTSSFILMIFLTYRRLPISLSQVAVGAAIGAAIAEGIQVNWIFTSIIASSWFLTPIAGFLAANAISRVTRRLGKSVRGLFTQNVMYSYLTIASGVYASYTLGANTVGLIVGMVDAPASEHLLVSIMLGLATVIGMVLLSRGTTLSVAENIVEPGRLVRCPDGRRGYSSWVYSVWCSGFSFASGRGWGFRGCDSEKDRCSKRPFDKGNNTRLDCSSNSRSSAGVGSLDNHLDDLGQRN